MTDRRAREDRRKTTRSARRERSETDADQTAELGATIDRIVGDGNRSVCRDWRHRRQRSVSGRIGQFPPLDGVQTMLFESADAFLSSDRIQCADCLIVDYRMPGTNGLHLARKLTDMKYPAPIIMVTMSAEDIREAALGAGVAAVFPKRVSPDVLVDAIQIVLGREQSPPE